LQHFYLGIWTSLTEQPVKAESAEGDLQSNSEARLKYLSAEPQKGALTVQLVCSQWLFRDVSYTQDTLPKVSTDKFFYISQ